MNSLIHSTIEILQQNEAILKSIEAEHYQKIIPPFFISSCGEHVRHILDHFMALKNGFRQGMINYNDRSRDSDIEYNKQSALQKIEEIKTWISQLSDADLQQPIKLITEISISDSITAQLDTSLARELVFSASHAVHHYSMIKIALEMQDISVDSDFGIAPATSTYLRSQNKNNNKNDQPCAH